jgi:hypothetical protein
MRFRGSRVMVTGCISSFVFDEEGAGDDKC